MKRSAIGSTKIDTDKYLFTIDKPLSDMRQNQVRLISYLDLLQEKAQFTEKESELKQLYDAMDMSYCIYCIIDQFAENPKYLENSLYYYMDAIVSGEFDKEYNSLEERNNQLNQAIQSVIDKVISNCAIDSIVENDDLIWWQENVIDLNYFELNGERSNVRLQDVAINGVTKKDFLEEFKRSGCAWSYIRCDKSLIEDNKVAIYKYGKQKNMQALLAQSNFQLDTVTQNNLIDAGILKETNGKSANDCVYSLREKAKAKKSAKISGDPFTIIATIVTIIATCVGIASQVFEVVRAGKTNYDARQLDPQYMIDETDWSDIFDSDRDGMIDTKWLILGAIALGIGAYYFS